MRKFGTDVVLCVCCFKMFYVFELNLMKKKTCLTLFFVLQGKAFASAG